MQPGTLFVAATPIGNLGDATQRLREILERCEPVACEDTRRTRQLCTALGVSARLVRCDEHEEEPFHGSTSFLSSCSPLVRGGTQLPGLLAT